MTCKSFRNLKVAVCFAAVLAMLGLVVFGAEEKQWTYKQTTGELLLDGKAVGKGYSGHGEGLNNPDQEAIRDVGPIPAGNWSIGDAFKHETKGPMVMRLSPDGHKAHGRDGFLIHGDNKKGDKSASNGCIILGPDLRDKISKSGIKKLKVVKE
jgi:hypothetical protein